MKGLIVIKAVLFDMNGVLVDSEGINTIAWQELFKEYGLDFSLELYKMRIDGKSTREVADGYGIIHVDQFVEKKDEIWSRLYVDKGINLFDDVLRNLKELKENGVLLGVTSSSRKTDMILKDMNLADYFDVIVDSELIKRGKPSPDIYIEAMRLLNVEANETIAVEDSYAGINAASQAHIFCYKICRNGEINDSVCCIKTLDDIWKGWFK